MIIVKGESRMTFAWLIHVGLAFELDTREDVWGVCGSGDLPLTPVGELQCHFEERPLLTQQRMVSLGGADVPVVPGGFTREGRK